MYKIILLIKTRIEAMILSFYDFITEQYTKTDLNLLNQFMNKRKVKHSCKVAELVALLTSSEDVYNAALYHDYVERGGTVEELKKVVSGYSYALIMALTKTETDLDDSSDKNAVLSILKSKLLLLPENMRNDIILIKIADRTDNLRKRMKADSLSKSYLKKSADLVQFLLNAYTGSDRNKLIKFANKFIIEIYPKMKKRISTEKPNGLYEKRLEDSWLTSFK